MIEVVTVDAVSTIRLLESIEALYPLLALIHPRSAMKKSWTRLRLMF
jgi:hypothetical protein